MRKRIMLGLVLMFCIVTLTAQRADELIRARHPELALSENFHAFLYPLAGASTTFAPQAIKGMRELNKPDIRHSDEDIVFIFSNEGGIAPGRVRDYLHKAFLWSDSQMQQVKYVIDDTLYHQLNTGGELVKQLYFYHGDRQYDKVVKLHSIRAGDIMHDRFRLSACTPVRIRDSTTLYTTRDPLYRLDSTHLLILSDIDDRLVKIAPATGEIIATFTLQDSDAVALFCRHIAQGDTARCHYAQRYAAQLRTANRKALDIMSIVIDDSSIYCFVSIEAYQPSPGLYTYKDDEGVKKTKKTGDPILIPYYLLIRLDNSLHWRQAIQLTDIPADKTGHHEVYNTYDVGFGVNGSALTVQNTYYPAPPGKMPALSRYIIAGDSLRWSGFLPPRSTHSEQKKNSYYNLETFYFDFAGKSLFSYDHFGRIYFQEADGIAGHWCGDGSPPYKKEVYQLYAEVTVRKPKMNFAIHSIGAILGSRYLAAAYVYKGKTSLLEIKDLNLHTAGTLRLDHLSVLQQYFDSHISSNLLIAHDKLYFLSADSKGYYVNAYEIKEIDGR